MNRSLGAAVAGFVFHAVIGAALMGGASRVAAADFLRGDVDGSGRVAVTDAIRILLHLFQGDAAAVPCKDAGDVDDSGALDVADVIHLLSGLFRGGPVPAAPFPSCGADPTEDLLGCEEGCPPLTTYFGKELRVDGLFFVIDRSDTMLDKLPRAKQETVRLLEALPPGLEFGVIFSDAGVIKFPASGQPAESTEEMKASGAAFVRSVAGGAGSCDLPALMAALDFAGNARGSSRAVLYVTDGGGTCQGGDEAQYLKRALASVAAANGGRARIHTFNVTPGPGIREQFLQDLAAQNGGTYNPLP